MRFIAAAYWRFVYSIFPMPEFLVIADRIEDCPLCGKPTCCCWDHDRRLRITSDSSKGAK